jgi:hypothetical protein
MIPYLTVPFKFTNESFTWINGFINPIVADYNANAPRASALLNLSNNNHETLLKSLAWEEIVQFTDNLKLKKPFPQVFIYKKMAVKRSCILGNPHIDTAGAGGIETTVAARFNILLDGHDDTEMTWWDINRNDNRITNYKLQRPDRTYTGRLQAAGSNLQEQWKNIGEPVCKANNLARTQEYASFVRTDILHALNWTGLDPRLVLSIKFDLESWDQIEALRV